MYDWLKLSSQRLARPREQPSKQKWRRKWFQLSLPHTVTAVTNCTDLETKIVVTKVSVVYDG